MINTKQSEKLLLKLPIAVSMLMKLVLFDALVEDLA